MSTLVTKGMGGGGEGAAEDDPLAGVGLNFGWYVDAVGLRTVHGRARFEPFMYIGATARPLIGPGGRYDISTSQCSAVSMLLRIEHPDDTPFDTHGSTVTFTVRRRVTDTVPAYQLASNTFTDLLLLGDGYVSITVPSEVTGTLKGDNVYLLDVLNADGSVGRVMSGQFYVAESVTGLVFA